MTATEASPDPNDRAVDQPSALDATVAQSGEGQLELFEAASIDGPRLPPAADLVLGRSDHDGEGNGADMTDAGLSPLERSLPDAGASDPDELRRLEASIRWLQNESSVHRLPRAATLPPVAGLPPFGTELRVHDATRPDAETLHPQDRANQAAFLRRLDPGWRLPRSLLSRGGAGALLKLLIASAIAVP